MYLAELEIFGFKSFPQKTVFKFSGGITALVGPNGCGKTNIVDAIRWVLGEQKSSVLRSDTMDNVIFNGTSTRRPLGMAEVNMKIENTRNILPSEYSEVNITRRIFRSGDSNYLLNKTKCRMKDIHELFMDTGMGSDSYSVIELKMVEAILSGKVEERRHLFEEAAGITKYKQRRKEAGNKLNRVQEDLDRVRDIVAEISKNVGTLGRQAAKTKRYNTLLGELKILEMELLKHEYYEFNSKIKEFDLVHQGLENQIILFTNDLDTADTQYNLLKETYSSLEANYSATQENEKLLNNEFTNTKRDIAVAEEKKKSIFAAQERIKIEMQEADSLFARLQNEEKELAEQIFKTQEIKIEFEGLVDLKNENVKEQKIILDEQREDVNQVRQNILNIENKINNEKTIKSRSELKKIGLDSKLKANQEEIIVLNGFIQQIEEESISLSNAEHSFNANLFEAEQSLNLAKEKKTHLNSLIDSIKQNLSNSKNQLGAKKATLDFLNSLTDSNATSKFLLDNKFKIEGFEPEILAESIGADEQFRIALGSLLGDSSHYLIVDTDEDAQNAFDFLIASGKGKASIVSKNSIPNLPIPKEIKTDVIYGQASELVRVDDKLRNFLRALFGNTVVVENKESALIAINEFKVDKAVTLSGEIYSNFGLKRGGGLLKDEGITIGKNERITKIKSEIKEVETEINNLNLTLEDNQEELKNIDISKLEKEFKQIENDIKNNNYKYSELQLKKQSFEQNLELIDQATQRYKNDIKEIDNEYESIDEVIAEHEQILNDEKSKYMKISEVLTLAENDYNKAAAEFREVEIKQANIKTEIAQFERDLQRVKHQIDNEINRSKTRETEISNNNIIIDNIDHRLINLTSDISELETKLNLVSNERQYLEEQKKDISEQLSAELLQINELRRNLDKAKDSIHKNELVLSDLNAKANFVTSRALENYETDITLEEFNPNSEFSFQNSKQEVAELKEKLSAIGSVNFEALEQFEEQSQRLDFYEKQVADLTESQKTLQETIEEINQTAERNFIETFDKIRDNFKYLFSKLFDEDGFADIKLGDGNPLEADISITAKPPGKKPHSIEMLSGGEKTLTAIALLFSIYMVKPSPFCILDEVDAPLDDANIGRFISMIRQFSDETQFLIVTHNKKTMEAADTLYGITQQETGISKIVSVRLGEMNVA